MALTMNDTGNDIGGETSIVPEEIRVARDKKRLVVTFPGAGRFRSEEHTSELQSH